MNEAAETCALELTLPGGAPVPLLRAAGAKAGRWAAVALVWHDSPDRDLAGQGLALVERRQGKPTAPPVWRVERIAPAATAIAPAGTPDVLLAEAGLAPAALAQSALAQAALAQAALADALPHRLPDPLLPLCGFAGRFRTAVAGEVQLRVLDGVLRTVAATQPICRVTLSGPPAAVVALAAVLASAAGAAVPRISLAAEAHALAGHVLPPRREGAPALPEGLSVSAAIAFVCGHLADVIQHFAPLAAAGAGADSEPVHQLRVAVRRLRSAMKLFHPLVACPELDETASGLQALGRVLGPARDWDVFLSGAGRAVAAAFPAEASVQRLMAAAERRRAAAYAAVRDTLAGAAFRQLGITLVVCAQMRPWETASATQQALISADLRDFAEAALTRRWRRLVAPGGHIARLPDARLHRIRLQAKRMRYAAEIFSHLHGRREAARLIDRVSALQERLGHLNDAAVAAALMAELGRTGHGFAAGVVSGFVVAQSLAARDKIGSGWRKLRKTPQFWT